MSASSSNFFAARQAAFGIPENTGHGPLGNMQIQVGPDGTLRIVPVQTTTESPAEPILSTDQQDPDDSLYRGLVSQRIDPRKLPQPKTIKVRNDFYPVSAPEPRSDYVWVNNRRNLGSRTPGTWYKIGSPMRQEMTGTGVTIPENGVFGPEHHGMGMGVEPSMSDEQIKNQLANYGLPSTGTRPVILERLIKARLSPTTMASIAEGKPVSEQDLNLMFNRDTMAQSADLFKREREQGMKDREAFLERKAQQPQTNPSPLNQPSTNTQLQGTTTTTTSAQPPNVVQPPPSQEPQGPLYGGTMRLGDEAPMSTSIIGGGASESQPLTQSPNLYSRIAPQANTGAVAAEEAGAMGGMEMMASRAIPMLNMVLMGKMLVDGVTADSKQKKMQQQALMYRT
jgi:hypothetical protein